MPRSRSRSPPRRSPSPESAGSWINDPEKWIVGRAATLALSLDGPVVCPPHADFTTFGRSGNKVTPAQFKVVNDEARMEEAVANLCKLHGVADVTAKNVTRARMELRNFGPCTVYCLDVNADSARERRIPENKDPNLERGFHMLGEAEAVTKVFGPCVIVPPLLAELLGDLDMLLTHLEDAVAACEDAKEGIDGGFGRSREACYSSMLGSLNDLSDACVEWEETWEDPMEFGEIEARFRDMYKPDDVPAVETGVDACV